MRTNEINELKNSMEPFFKELKEDVIGTVISAADSKRFNAVINYIFECEEPNYLEVLNEEELKYFISEVALAYVSNYNENRSRSTRARIDEISLIKYNNIFNENIEDEESNYRTR